MTKRIGPSLAVLLLAASAFLLRPGSLPSKEPEKKQLPTAVEIAKEWRYPSPPGVIMVPASLTPLKSQAFYIELYEVKADYADVWNHFAAKSGSNARFRDKMIWGLMDKLQGPDTGHLMVYDDGYGQEAHFGQNTETRTVHVEIRKAGNGTVGVRVVVGVR